MYVLLFRINVIITTGKKSKWIQHLKQIHNESYKTRIIKYIKLQSWFIGQIIDWFHKNHINERKNIYTNL